MISAEQMRRALVGAGVPHGAIGLFDLDYELPEPGWITGELGAAFRGFLFSAGLAGVEEQFDCNKFSKAATVLADVCWARTRREPAALAFGLFGFASREHCVCVAVHTVRPGSGAVGDLRVAFYEPQPSPYALAEVKLSEEDIQSCVCCLFI